MIAHFWKILNLLKVSESDQAFRLSRSTYSKFIVLSGILITVLWPVVSLSIAIYMAPGFAALLMFAIECFCSSERITHLDSAKRPARKLSFVFWGLFGMTIVVLDAFSQFLSPRIAADGIETVLELAWLYGSVPLILSCAITSIRNIR